MLVLLREENRISQYSYINNVHIQYISRIQRLTHAIASFSNNKHEKNYLVLIG